MRVTELDDIEARMGSQGTYFALPAREVRPLIAEVRRLRLALEHARDAIEPHVDADFDGERYVANWAGSLVTDIDIALGNA